MNSKKFRRFAALMLAGTMTIGSGMMVLAADASSITSAGTADYEGDKVENDIIQVTLPTINAGTYNYKADPNELLTTAANNGSLGNTVTIDSNDGILFLYETNKYGASSTALEVESKSAVDVDITVKAEADSTYDGLATFNADSAFTDSTEKELYIAVVNSTDASNPVSDGIKGLGESNAASVTYTIKGVPTNFELTYDSTKGYTYAEKTTGTTDYNKAKFNLTGAINKNAEWTGVAEKGLPDITVTWSYAKHVDSYLSADTVDADNNVLTLSLPTGVTVTGADCEGALTLNNHYFVENGTLRIKGLFIQNNTGKTITVTYSDGHTDAITIQ